MPKVLEESGGYLCGYKVVVRVGLPQHGQQAFGGGDRALEVFAAAYLKALQDDLSAVQLLTKSLELLQCTTGPQNRDVTREC